MPELPDVEIFRRYANRTALHERIQRVADFDDGVLSPGLTPQKLGARLHGESFEETARRGKHLFLRLSGGGWIEMHFGMTGALRYEQDEGEPPRHTRVELVFRDGWRLDYLSVRKLGHLGLAEDPEAFADEHGLGPDPVAGGGLSMTRFKELAGKRRGGVKSALMDQSFLAGIGNLYSDEMLFRARIHPAAEVGALGEKRVARLFRAMRTVLRKAVDYRVDVDRMPRTWLLPHRDERDPACPRCGTGIETARIHGRTSYFCPKCQRK